MPGIIRGEEKNRSLTSRDTGREKHIPKADNRGKIYGEEWGQGRDGQEPCLLTEVLEIKARGMEYKNRTGWS